MMKTCAMLISKADCIARDKILFSKLLDVSEVFETLCTQSRLLKNKGKGKYQRKMLLHIAKTAILFKRSNYKVCIGRCICSSVHPKMKTDFMQTMNLLTIELQLRV